MTTFTDAKNAWHKEYTTYCPNGDTTTVKTVLQEMSEQFKQGTRTDNWMTHPLVVAADNLLEAAGESWEDHDECIDALQFTI